MFTCIKSRYSDSGSEAAFEADKLDFTKEQVDVFCNVMVHGNYYTVVKYRNIIPVLPTTEVFFLRENLNKKVMKWISDGSFPRLEMHRFSDYVFSKS